MNEPPIVLELGDPFIETMDGSRIVRATQRLGAVKIGGWVLVTPELLADVDGPSLNAYVASKLDRIFRPWNYPDRPITFGFDPFPRWTRFAAWLRKVVRR